MRGPSRFPTLVRDRFNSKWMPEPFSGCWLWTAANNGVYGTLRDNRENGFRSKFAHRFSWEIHNGEIPNGFLVLHKCDTPLCVNPEHLFLGTYQDNRLDAIKKGRQIIPRNELGQFSHK